MEIEIYMPCRPEWICDIILVVVTILFCAGIVAFVWVIWKEHQQINKKNRKP
ncbi:hypothetical protein P7F88_18890 [Vibrio hannami]|uniref:hypothetical protein n=1 Tax=Vibrio hannami TaxID=2717094 RepID=UPI00240EEBF3|nr:hypothetical protein [Vibrio hannami]MDG3088031.1 hypothetical protein [Vibrio hannami]